MPTPAEILRDPKFLALPLGERRKVLLAVDPQGFGALPEQEQTKVVGAVGGQGIDYVAAEKEQAKPSLLSDPRGWWKGLNDDEKQAVLDNIGEFTGGTAGAIAGGGPMSIPGAAIGAVGGKNIARIGGQMAGLKPKKETAAEVLKDQAVTAATNAVGEGVGRLAPLVTHAGMVGAGNALRRGLVDPAAQETARLATAQGVPVTAPMLSPAAGKVEAALERFPTAEPIIRKSKMAAQVPWEGNLEKLASEYYPRPVSNIESGEAARTGLAGNRGVAQGYYQQQYAALNKVIGDAPIDTTPVKEMAAEFLASVPEDATRAFPGGTVGKLRQIAGMGGAENAADEMSRSLAGRAFKDLDEVRQKQVLDTMRRLGLSTEEMAPQMTFREAQSLRTQLLETERRLQHTDPSLNRSAFPRLRKALDTSIEESLSQSPDPEHVAALQQWRDLNKKYRGTALQLEAPSRSGKPGSTAASIIDRENAPERLPQRLTSSETPFRQAATATDRATTASMQPPVGSAAQLAPPPMPGQRPAVNIDPQPSDMLRRNFADELVNKSRLNDRGMSDVPVVSARRLETNIRKEPETINTVLGPDAYQKYQEAVRVGKAFNPRDVNPSGTAATSETIREARKAAGAAAAIGAAGGGGYLMGKDNGQGMSDALTGAGLVAAGLMAPRSLAKQFVKPEFAQFLLRPRERAFNPAFLGGPLSGALGRAGAMTTEEEELPPFAEGGVVTTTATQKAAVAKPKKKRRWFGPPAMPKSKSAVPPPMPFAK